MGDENKPMSESDRLKFNKEMLTFLAAMAAEIKDLNRMMDSTATDSHQLEHNKLVVSFLLNVSGLFMLPLLTDFSHRMIETEKLQLAVRAHAKEIQGSQLVSSESFVGVLRQQ